MQITYKRWKYKNTSILILSLVLLFYIANSTFFQPFINVVSKIGYLGSFIAGMFFVSTFTVAPAGLVLYKLAQVLNPFLIALSGGLGAVIGDYILFRFLKDKVFEELTPLFKKLGGQRVLHLLSTPYFVWLAPVIGVLIITSPFPDEIGIGLLGLSKLKNWQFILLSFIFNTVGILSIITVVKLF